MATFKDRDVFEYCEKLYEQFKKIDNGYYPHKHDDAVFQQVANHFAIKKKDAVDIYNSYSKLAAKLEMMRINRLPAKKRKAALMRRMQDIVLNNKDLPFYKKEGEPSSPILPTTVSLENDLKEPVINVAKAGWTIPLTIEVEQLVELINCHGAESIDLFFENFYTEERVNKLQDIIESSIENPGQKKRWEECCSIFKKGMYSSCLTVLTTILEGKISSFGDNPEDVRMMRICNFQMEEERKKGNNVKSLCWLSMYEYIRLLFEKSNFSKEEPNATNRHWLVHGRTSQINNKLDCIRLINALSTLSNLK